MRTERKISMTRQSLRHSLRHSLPRRVLALALAAALFCPPGGLLVAASAQQAPPVAQEAPAPAAPALPAGSSIVIPTSPVAVGPIHSILLFPFASNLAAGGSASAFNADQVGARVEDAVKLRLNVIGRYKANSFSPTLPQIQRALQEARVEGLSEADLVPPYNDAQKAQKIAAQVGTDGYLLGTIESLNAAAGTRNVSLTVTATLYHSESGAVARALAFTGHGVSYNPSDDADALLQSAINDVAGQIVSALNGSVPTHLASPDSARGHRSNGGSILLGILIATAVGIAIGSSSHHNNNNNGGSITPGTGSTGPPAPPGLNSGNNPSSPPPVPTP